MIKEKKVRKGINKKYAFGVYKPNKNCKPVTYKGTKYLSKAQCMALEGITRKELDEYLNGGLGEINEAIDVEDQPAKGLWDPDVAPDDEDLNDVF